MGFRKFTYSAHCKLFQLEAILSFKGWAALERNVNISVYKLCKFPKSGCEVWQL